MKIVYLTAGAAGMFCGSCMNDNAVAKELVKQGHDCLLVPTYTPIRTDDDNVSVDRVFLGGVNLYLQQKIPFIGSMPKWLDAILNHPRLIKQVTKNAGKTSPVLLGQLAVSMLQGHHGKQKKEFERLLNWLETEIKPDLIVLTNLLIGGSLPELKHRLGAKVLVTLQGDDIFLDSLPARYRDRATELMRDLAKYVDGFVSHSQAYAKSMGERFRIPVERIHVVPLAIPLEDFESIGSHENQNASGTKASYSLGYFARMAPEKGLHRLVDAFIELSKEPEWSRWNLKLAGWMGPQHDTYWKEQQAKLSAAGLDGRWEYLGSIDRTAKSRFLASLDLFCVPTVYAEPKGLFLLESVASGLRYVQPDHGAFPELHERLHQGTLFRHDSQESLVAALEQEMRALPVRTPLTNEMKNELRIETHVKRLLAVVDAIQP